MLCSDASCYLVLLASIVFMSCLVVVVHTGSSDVQSDACLPSVIKYRGYACSFASSWLHAYFVVFLLCSCMVFIHDASSHAMLLCSVMIMLVSMSCSFRYMIHCGYAR
jgi:hypothetical protein